MKPESLVIKRIRDEIKRRDLPIHLDKTNNPYTAGWLDLYVEAPQFVGWIEAKYQPHKYAPGETVTPDSKVKARSVVYQLSAQQIARACRHVGNGIPTAVLCGFAGPHQQLRTYAFFPFRDLAWGGSAHDKLGWPDSVRVLTVQQTVGALDSWVNGYYIKATTND